MSGQLQAVATVLSWKEPWYCLNRILAVSNSKSRCLGEERPFCCCCWVPHIVAEKCHRVIYHRPSEPWLKSFLFGMCNVCARRSVYNRFQIVGVVFFCLSNWWVLPLQRLGWWMKNVSMVANCVLEEWGRKLLVQFCVTVLCWYRDITLTDICQIPLIMHSFIILT